MPFRLQVYLRPLGPVLIALGALRLLLPRSELARAIGGTAIFVMIALAAGGGLLGLVFLFTGVRFRCPFCGTRGSGALEGNGLPWMDCTTCGTVRCEGPLGFRIVRDRRSSDAD